MPAGRPRTTCPPKEELEALGAEMCEWLQNTPDALHISDWYLGEKFFIKSVWDAMLQHSEFLVYYEKAKQIIGRKYLDKNSRVRDNIAPRWQRIYYKDIKMDEDELIKFKAEVSSKAAKDAGCTPEQIKAIQDNINFLTKNDHRKTGC